MLRPRLLQSEEPTQLLRVDGRACKRFRSADQYNAIEAMEGFIGWNGRDDIMIDRFDGRAILDFYREPDERVRNRVKGEEQLELDEVNPPTPPYPGPSFECISSLEVLSKHYHVLCSE